MLDVRDDIGPARLPAEQLPGALTGSLLIEHQRIGIGTERFPGFLQRPANPATALARATARSCGHVTDPVGKVRSPRVAASLSATADPMYPLAPVRKTCM